MAPSHIRSFSTAPTPSSPPIRLSRATSASAVHSMAAATATPRGASPSPSRVRSYNDEDGNLTTIPDPRSRTMSLASGVADSQQHHPDLSDEVAALSTKLINAINHQTNLDDTLNATRHELESARDRIRQLEKDAEENASKISTGALVSSVVVQSEKSKLMAALGEEKKQRGEVEKEKKRIEQELENLTAALFEEANKMVITARESAQREHDIVQRTNDQLKSQLADTESLLKLHQEQLAELKQVMEQMNAGRDDQSSATAPSTPGGSKFDKDEIVASPDVLHSSSSMGDLQPSYPTSYTHLLQPILRTDLAAYDDFTSLLRISKSNAGSRISSGSFNGLGLGLGLGGHNSAMSTVANQLPSNGSTSSLATSAAFSSNPGSPTTPASSVSASSSGPNVQIPLKETRFYKRALAEDIEPTLRLDTAPGLSWLARRSVLNAMCEGNLVVEPMPTPSNPVQRLYHFACALCGESRKDKEHARTHRFRTSETDNAQRYPLCKYCLGRVRSSCDFLGFLRMIRDGHWRTDDEESEKFAWEESVRLREQMFWARMGGGVVPVNSVHHQHHSQAKSPRHSEEAETIRELKEEVDRTGEIQPRDITPVTDSNLEASPKPDEASNELFLEKRKAEKLKNQAETADGLWQAAQADAEGPKGDEDGKDLRDKNVEAESQASNRDSSQSLNLGDDKKGEKRLSITIP